MIILIIIFIISLKTIGAEGDITIAPIENGSISGYDSNWRIDFTQNYNHNGLGALTIKGEKGETSLKWNFHREVLNYDNNENGIIHLTKTEFILISSLISSIADKPMPDGKISESGYQFV